MTGWELDYSMYGVFNGVPMIPSYNREERRKYIKQHRHDKDATHCDYCNAKTLKFTDDNCDIVCELCGRITEKHIEYKPNSFTSEVNK